MTLFSTLGKFAQSNRSFAAIFKSFPFPPTGDDGVVYGINQSDAQFVITSQNLLHKLNNLSSKLKNLHTIVYIRNEKSDSSSVVRELKDKNLQVYSYDEVETNGAKLPAWEVPPPSPEDLAIIMYTR